MKPVKLKDVKRERRAANQDRKAIEQGELLVFAGRPTPSETGTLSLRDSSGIEVVLREEDIVELQEDGGVLFAHVSVSTDVMVRYETVFRPALHRQDDDCGCDSDSDGAVLTRDDELPILRVPGEIPDPGEFDPGPSGVICEPKLRCEPYRTIDGILIEPCRVVLDCRRLGVRQFV